MKQTGFIQGDTSEAKFASIERALQRLSRRSHKQVGVKIPPIPVSGFVEAPDENGLLARYMFPAGGVAKTGVIVIEQFPEKEKRIMLNANILTADEEMTKEFEVTPKINQISLNFNVAVGSRFELSLKDPKIEISRIWWGLLYQISPKQSELALMLHEDLEKIENEIKS